MNTVRTTEPRIRVAYVAHALMIGGAEEMVLNLVRHLPERFEPMVCCIHSAGPVGEEGWAHIGVPFLDFCLVSWATVGRVVVGCQGVSSGCGIR